jgi:hypothetical protein
MHHSSNKNIEVRPRGLSGLALWAGSDHYNILAAVRRDTFRCPASGVNKIYCVSFSDIPGFQEDRFLVEYDSGNKSCIIILNALPPELSGHRTVKISPAGAVRLYLQTFWREPSALALPLILPLMICLMMGLFGVWDELVLRNPDVMAFFARPGCDSGCVKKVLSLHSLVGLLFLIQFFLFLLPILFLFFQAPRYRSAFNYRVIQTYSVITAVIGIYVFGQLMVFFPFRQYSRFLALGMDPKVEKIFSHMKDQKEKL